ncbi:MAG: isoamylase early set domain-containing protein [Acidimicrobiia bacterium]
MSCTIVSSVDPATGRCTVEFRLAPEVGAEHAWLVGDFNDWSTDTTALEREPDGSLVAALDLEVGRSYRFRYYLGNGRWENDWAADDYLDNDHGGSDSVVRVAPASTTPEKAKVATTPITPGKAKTAPRPPGLLPPPVVPPA